MIVKIWQNSNVNVNEQPVKVLLNPNVQVSALKPSYPPANTPLAGDDKFIVRQGNDWREVDRSEIGGGSQSFATQKAGLVNSATTLIHGTYTRVGFELVEFDNNGLVIDGKTGFKIKEPGTYIVNGLATITKLEDGKKMVVRLKINGSYLHLLGRGTSGANDLAGFGGSVMVNLDVDDIVEMWVYHNNPININLYVTDYGYSYLQIFKIDNV